MSMVLVVTSYKSGLPLFTIYQFLDIFFSNVKPRKVDSFLALPPRSIDFPVSFLKQRIFQTKIPKHVKVRS